MSGTLPHVLLTLHAPTMTKRSHARLPKGHGNDRWLSLDDLSLVRVMKALEKIDRPDGAWHLWVSNRIQGCWYILRTARESVNLCPLLRRRYAPRPVGLQGA